jgi:hypothetical protein
VASRAFVDEEEEAIGLDCGDRNSAAAWVLMLFSRSHGGGDQGDGGGDQGDGGGRREEGFGFGFGCFWLVYKV